MDRNDRKKFINACCGCDINTIRYYIVQYNMKVQPRGILRDGLMNIGINEPRGNWYDAEGYYKDVEWNDQTDKHTYIDVLEILDKEAHVDIYYNNSEWLKYIIERENIEALDYILQQSSRRVDIHMKNDELFKRSLRHIKSADYLWKYGLKINKPFNFAFLNNTWPKYITEEMFKWLLFHDAIQAKIDFHIRDDETFILLYELDKGIYRNPQKYYERLKNYKHRETIREAIHVNDDLFSLIESYAYIVPKSIVKQKLSTYDVQINEYRFNCRFKELADPSVYIFLCDKEFIKKDVALYDACISEMKKKTSLNE